MGPTRVLSTAKAEVLAQRVNIGQADQKATQAIFDEHNDWICTENTMALAVKDAIYLLCLPADRGFEVANNVIDNTEGPGWKSAVFDQASCGPGYR
jgi:ornithine carbamoyltransferase